MVSEPIKFDGAMAADDTGVYWYDDERGEMGTGFIRKFTRATGEVTDSATAESVRFLRAGGGRVVWADAPSLGDREAIVWSNTPDGSPTGPARPPSPPSTSSRSMERARILLGARPKVHPGV